MSVSLSSILNPADDNGAQHSPPPESRRDPRTSIDQGAQSHGDQRQQQPPSSPVSTRSTQAHAQPQTTAHEAAQALAALSASPGLTSSQWHGNGVQDQSQGVRRYSNERRPGSGYGEPIQLPPPPPQSEAARKMSSPTLEQYQVASRSPERRRSSVVSPTQSNITLPPIQTLAPAQTEHLRRTSFSMAREIPSLTVHDGNSGETASHVISPPTSAVDLIPSNSLPSHIGPVLGQSKPEDDGRSSPAIIKQEKMPTPQPPSPVGGRRASDVDQQTSKTLAALKTEHSARTHSPLRESSIPLPTTEVVQAELPATTKKRTASAKTKKGTATTMKRAPPAKKRKVEPVRSATPLSHMSKSNGKGASGKGTPADSSPAPSTRSQSADPNEEAYDDDEDEDMEDDPDADVYCICRRPDNGTFMIGCDGTCDDWFHGKCVSINERDKNLIDKYICPNCTQAGVGRTTWKRMCRRNGCRQPAKVGKTKSGASNSKYCSDECGVLYFRELSGRTRGREEAVKNRSSRRKSSVNHAEKPHLEDDLGARGGVLSANEVKALLNVSKTVDDFHRLGDGVLSPPATPDGKETKEFTESEQKSLATIQTQKEDARDRHALLKDRMQFVTMVKQAASRTAAEKELKPKEYCGYDPRLEWTEEQFQRWRKSKAGEQAFELGTLATEPSTNGDAMDVDGVADEDADHEICGRKKCARHLEWSKLAVDDLRFEMSDNGDRMRALAGEERAIRERAALRAKAGEMAGEGTVEVHGLDDRGGGGPVVPLEPETAPRLNGVQSIVETVETVEPLEPVEPMAIDAN